MSRDRMRKHRCRQVRQQRFAHNHEMCYVQEMPITYVSNQNIAKSEIECLVCPVITFGVMGSGIAKTFKETFPECVSFYVEARDSKALWLGRPMMWETSKDKPKYVCFFMIKQHWKKKGEATFIMSGLKELHNQLIEMGIKEVALPYKMGCKENRLDWELVKKMVISEFQHEKNINILVHE